MSIMLERIIRVLKPFLNSCGYVIRTVRDDQETIKKARDKGFIEGTFEKNIKKSTKQ